MFNCRLFTFLPLMALSLSVLITGCDGGSSSSSSTSPATTPAASVSGVVADGYLFNAKVCSDQNFNNVCDEGEPFDISAADGSYTLTGDNLDQFPIVVEIIAGETTDSDAPSDPIENDYVLSTPAGMPEFISPLTTMVHQQVQANPSLDVEDAEQVIMGQLGLANADGVSLFVNYVEQEEGETPAAADYEQLHDVAQVVATTFGSMQAEIEEALDGEGAPENDFTLDDVLEVVVQKVVEQLAEIVEQIESGEEFDPSAIAAGIVDSADLTVETIAEELEEAATEVAQSSFEEALSNGGFYSFWAGSYYDAQLDREMPELERWNIYLDEAGALKEDSFVFDFIEMDWVAADLDDDERILTSEGWVTASDAPENYTVVFNDDGTATMTHKTVGIVETIVAVELDLEGVAMAPFVGEFDELLSDPTATFPAGAKGYEVSFKMETDSYRIWIDEDDQGNDQNLVQDWSGRDPVAVPTLADVVTVFAKDNAENQYLYFEYSLALQFDADNKVTVYRIENGPENALAIGEGQYEELTINNQNAFMFSFPAEMQDDLDLDGQMFLIQWDAITVKRGEFEAGGTFMSDDEYGLNKIAYDAVVENIEIPTLVDPVPDGPVFTAQLLAGNNGTFYVNYSDESEDTRGEETLTFDLQLDGSYLLTIDYADYVLSTGVEVDSGSVTFPATLAEDGTVFVDSNGLSELGGFYAVFTLTGVSQAGYSVAAQHFDSDGTVVDSYTDLWGFTAPSNPIPDPVPDTPVFTPELLAANGGVFYISWEDEPNNERGEESLTFVAQLGGYQLTVAYEDSDMAGNPIDSGSVVYAASIEADGSIYVDFLGTEVDNGGATYAIVTLTGVAQEGYSVTWTDFNDLDVEIDSGTDVWAFAAPIVVVPPPPVIQPPVFTSDLLASNGGIFYINWQDDIAREYGEEALTFVLQLDGSYQMTLDFEDRDMDSGAVIDSGTVVYSATIMDDGRLNVDFLGTEVDNGGATYAIMTLTAVSQEGYSVSWQDLNDLDVQVDAGTDLWGFSSQMP